MASHYTIKINRTTSYVTSDQLVKGASIGLDEQCEDCGAGQFVVTGRWTVECDGDDYHGQEREGCGATYTAEKLDYCPIKREDRDATCFDCNLGAYPKPKASEALSWF